MLNKLSIIVPVFNEEKSVFKVLDILCNLKFPNQIKTEIIVVNDKSTDNSLSEIEKFISASSLSEIKIVSHSINKGKGAAIHTGVEVATGDYIVIQDADLELNPQDIISLIQPIIDGKADVVYGSRFINSKLNFTLSKIANHFLTWLSNFVFGTKITDMETCYKVIPTKVFQSLVLKEQRFGFEPEITAKLAKIKHLRWAELPIYYNPRNAEQGKKINWKDGIRAMYCILKYGWFTSKKSSIKS